MSPVPIRNQKNVLDSPFIAILITMIVFGAYISLYLVRHTGKTTFLVEAGETFCDAQLVPSNLYIHPGVPGYDGEFYYRLALDPLSHEVESHGITSKFDSGAYRQQRIVYPLLAWAVSLGNPLRAGRALLIVNFVALAGISFVSAVYAQRKGQHALWGLLVSLQAGAFTTIALDTTELVALFFVLLSLFEFDRQKYVYAAVWGTVAVLSRETSLVVSTMMVIALALQATLLKRPSSSADGAGIPLAKPPTLRDGLPFIAPFAAYFLWEAYLVSAWHHSPWQDSGGRLGFPFVGIIDALKQGTVIEHSWHPLLTTHVVYLVLFGLLVIDAIRRGSNTSLPAILSWALFASCAYSYRYDPVYNLDWGYLRVLTEFFALGGFILIGSKSRAKGVVLAATVVADLAFALHMIYLR